jgi:hypothetical protein
VQAPQDMPVSIVSVVGAFRTGKSFLLDFFLRFLNSKGEPVHIRCLTLSACACVCTCLLLPCLCLCRDVDLRNQTESIILSFVATVAVFIRDCVCGGVIMCRG